MKRVLITGGARGIGKAIAERLAQEAELEIITPTRDELDLADPDSIARWTADSANTNVDILINNAGINIVEPIEEISEDDFNQVLQVNLHAPLRLTRSVVPHMKTAGWGRVVNISSIWGERSIEQRTLYSSSKSGLIGQTRALARELGPYGILVNAVSPGFTATELTFRVLDKAKRDELTTQVPVGRFAKPEEIAELVAFVSSERNTYMTGQSLVIDGGFLA